MTSQCTKQNPHFFPEYWLGVDYCQKFKCHVFLLPPYLVNNDTTKGKIALKSAWLYIAQLIIGKIKKFGVNESSSKSNLDLFYFTMINNNNIFVYICLYVFPYHRVERKEYIFGVK